MATRRSAAKPRTVDREPPQTSAPGPTAQEFAELRRQLVSLTGKYNELKEATGGVTLLPPEEVPVYEIGEGGYYSPDDVLYPAGVEIEDVTGTIIPNEQMIPLNRSAERRMDAYLRSLPQTGAANNHELFLEAALMVAHTFDAGGKNPVDAKLEFNKLVLDEMSRLQMKQRGMLPGDDTPRLQVKPQRTGPVPLMSNTRIRDGSLPPTHLAGPMPERGQVRTRMRSQGLAPSQKAAPAMGTVQNQTIGR